MRVTEENKLEYLNLLCEHFLCGDMQEQINVLLQGFWDICPKSDLLLLGITHRDLAILISGYSTLDVDEWRAHTKINSQSSDVLVNWFWEVVSEMANEDRAKLLHFVTGS